MVNGDVIRLSAIQLSQLRTTTYTQGNQWALYGPTIEDPGGQLVSSCTQPPLGIARNKKSMSSYNNYGPFHRKRAQ